MPPEPFVLLSDRRIDAVVAGESGEPLVDVGAVPELRLDRRYADADGAFGHLRDGVVSRLLDAQATLPGGLRFLVIEGYRPLDRQQSIFDGYLRELGERHPEWDPERVYVEATKFVSPVHVAPHSTGGAVDLTLCAEDGAEVDMGTEVDATPVASANACFTGAGNISGTARRHREILITALTSVGMINYPTEWWHWSFGERYWAFTTGADRTRYAPIRLPAAAVPR
ncbi:D-alanyl-D-alanine dipeptidase [Actinoplanes philippinensis]|uniref:D-alanyl-D-alanine dipeptidase n=1 Tax=Actinoplanes philippinensis TaxID=35752 RepID=A0A1I2G5N9_9ACTN|nr:M15 family metallopeptidase [Actinoplanes philippinensis]GIE76596.1 D-alanyl-D-alanine dipeptidase [Actinoplanes philippinensis]SFF12297.1 D-alanyl-D-alanine dipeptidase [Actinoplanes philippinensis]